MENRWPGPPDLKNLTIPSESVNKWRHWNQAAVIVALLLLAGVVWQWERGRNAEYRTMAGRMIAAETHARSVESQLALMLQNGERVLLLAELGNKNRVMIIDTIRGVVIANVDTREIGPVQIRMIVTK